MGDRGGERGYGPWTGWYSTDKSICSPRTPGTFLVPFVVQQKELARRRHYFLKRK